jgi:hypothetical protein
MIPLLIPAALGLIGGYLSREPKKYHLGGDMSKHLAPNGKQSKLTHEQWHLVRTPEFKAWFGDWDKAYETGNYEGVSKVIDEETKEPLVVYHGTQRRFKDFELPSYFGSARYSTEGGAEMGMRGKGIFFSSKEESAKTYSELNKRLKKNNRVIKVNLNINNPYIIDAKGEAWTGIIADEYKVGLNSKEYDGVIVKNVIDSATEDKILGDVYVVKHPLQIKQLADGTNTTFDGKSPDIRFEDGGELYRKISKEINEVNALSDKDLTPMQIQYLNKKLSFFLSDKMNTLKEKNYNLWQELRDKQMKVKDVLNKKETKEGFAGYLKEKYAYHFTNIFNLTEIVESKSIGNFQELGRVISLTTNPIFGEVEVSGVKSWNQGMDIKKAHFFSDLSVKIVFDLQKIKVDGIKIRKGSEKTGTHFGEYELIIPQFSEKDKWWKYVSWIEIDKNKTEIKEIFEYEWVKKLNIKDVMQLPIDIWINGKQAESTLGVELKKLGIEVREREKIDVEKYLFGDKKPKYADGGLIAPNGKPNPDIRFKNR